MKLQNSVSNIEQLRLCMTGAYNGKITEEEVIKAVKGEKEWSQEMKFGTAIDAVLDYGAEKFKLSDGTYLFQFNNMPGTVHCTYEELQTVIEFKNNHPNMVSQIPVYYKLNLFGDEILIKGRVDGIEGLILHEHKTSTGQPKHDQFKDSLQWQFYLLGSGCKKAVYNVFSYTKKPPRKTRLSQFVYEYYPGIENNVNSWIREFIEFCYDNNLNYYIEKDEQ